MKSIRADKGYSPKLIAADVRLILFHGPDEAASADLAAQLVAYLAPGGDEMAVVTLAPALLKSDPARLADEAAAVSMFGDRRVVRVDGVSEEVGEAVDLLLTAPAAGNPVVMTAGALRKGSKLLAAVEAAPKAMAVISYEPDARDAGRIVETIANELGLQPARDAAARLVDATGGDRGLLRRELEKLALFVDASPDRPQRLTSDDVLAVGAAIDDADFSALVDAVAGGRPALADRQLGRLLGQGIAGIALLRTVAKRLWLLAELRSAVDAGSSAQAVVDAARPPIFWKEKAAVAAQVERWRTAALRNALERLLATERDIKRSGGAGDVLAAQTLLAIAVQAAR
jgi:DNA polymerase-3 subunit delta